MSNPMEGFKMDPKLAEVMKRIKAEHPSSVVHVADEAEVSEQTVATKEKKKPRHFVTFIEKSLPPRDRE